jgi:hypothetical protein
MSAEAGLEEKECMTLSEKIIKAKKSWRHGSSGTALV